MSRLSHFLPATLVLAGFLPATLALQVANSSTPAPAGRTPPPANGSQTLKDRIVFVRADPSEGVSALRSLTDTSVNGTFQGRHAAPDFDATATRNTRKNEIQWMNPDGSGVTALKVYGSDPMLSPDGTRIVYCSERETLYSQIYVMNVDGSGQKRITNFNNGEACGPTWSHGGAKIAFHAFAQSRPSRNPEIWIMDADGSNQKRLTDHGLDPSWSPDDRQIAFASRRDGIFQIYAMNSDGSNLRRLTKHNSEDSTPVWAPDGKAIAYISATGDDRRGLFIMGPDGSDPHGLAYSKHQDFCFPSWSLDGRTLVFSALNRQGAQPIVVGEEKPRCEQWSGEYQLFAMDAEGKLHQLSDAKLMGTRPSYGRALVP